MENGVPHNKEKAQAWRRAATAPFEDCRPLRPSNDAEQDEGQGRFMLKGRGANASLLFVLEEGVNRVGRYGDNHIVLDSCWVSRFHAQIWLEDGVLTLRDLRSVNGSFVNGKRLRHARLTRGSALRFGDIAFLLIRESDQPSSWDRAFSHLSRFFVAGGG